MSKIWTWIPTKALVKLLSFMGAWNVKALHFRIIVNLIMKKVENVKLKCNFKIDFSLDAW